MCLMMTAQWLSLGWGANIICWYHDSRDRGEIFTPLMISLRLHWITKLFCTFPEIFYHVRSTLKMHNFLLLRSNIYDKSLDKTFKVSPRTADCQLTANQFKFLKNTFHFTLYFIQFWTAIVQAFIVSGLNVFLVISGRLRIFGTAWDFNEGYIAKCVLKSPFKNWMDKRSHKIVVWSLLLVLHRIYYCIILPYVSKLYNFQKNIAKYGRQKSIFL